jgi:hypothetical protein
VILHKNVNRIVAELVHLMISSVFNCMPQLCYSLPNTSTEILEFIHSLNISLSLLIRFSMRLSQW